jgi:hypothetical protein
MTTVVYCHGFASGPQGPSPKTDLIRALGHDVALIATNGDYRPAGYRAAFARLALDPTAPSVVRCKLFTLDVRLIRGALGRLNAKDARRYGAWMRAEAENWSSLDNFQRTRGVLKLMAKVTLPGIRP